VARAAQGASAAMMAPSAMAILVATFAEGHERNRALGVSGAMAAAGGGAGGAGRGAGGGGAGVGVGGGPQDVLGYTPAEFGLMTAVVPVTAVIASGISQRMVTRRGFRVVAVVNMLLMTAGFVLLTQVLADGNYAADLLPGLVLIGPGLGAATVAASIAAV